MGQNFHRKQRVPFAHMEIPKPGPKGGPFFHPNRIPKFSNATALADDETRCIAYIDDKQKSYRYDEYKFYNIDHNVLLNTHNSQREMLQTTGHKSD